MASISTRASPSTISSSFPSPHKHKLARILVVISYIEYKRPESSRTTPTARCVFPVPFEPSNTSFPDFFFHHFPPSVCAFFCSSDSAMKCRVLNHSTSVLCCIFSRKRMRARSAFHFVPDASLFVVFPVALWAGSEVINSFRLVGFSSLSS